MADFHGLRIKGKGRSTALRPDPKICPLRAPPSHLSPLYRHQLQLGSSPNSAWTHSSPRLTPHSASPVSTPAQRGSKTWKATRTVEAKRGQRTVAFVSQMVHLQIGGLEQLRRRFRVEAMCLIGGPQPSASSTEGGWASEQGSRARLCLQTPLSRGPITYLSIFLAFLVFSHSGKVARSPEGCHGSWPTKKSGTMVL